MSLVIFLTIISLFIVVPVRKKLDLNLNKSQSSGVLVNSRIKLPCLNQRLSVVSSRATTSTTDETKSIPSEEISTEIRPINTTMAKKRTRTYKKTRENTNRVASFQGSGREKGKPQIGTRKTRTTQCWLLYTFSFLLRQALLTIAR